MGVKGNKQSTDAIHAVDLLTEKLSQISGIASKRMFGGYGVFHDSKMFALQNSGGNIYLKADETIKTKFDEHGSSQHGKMPYFSLPEEVFNDLDKLTLWVGESIDISK